MSHTYFIADLHLDAKRPEISKIFSEFLSTQVIEADALYILGDLFEYWVGDDQPTSEFQACIDGLRKLKAHNIPVYFIHGNRDFLIGKAFAEQTGIIQLPDSKVIDLYDTPALIMHGDTLCTDDADYQQLRSMLRDKSWQQDFIKTPINERIRKAQQLREQSKQATAEKDDHITDVNTDEVIKVMQQNNVNLLIHGHTHRPATHNIKINNLAARRIVLGDWYHSGSALKIEPSDTTSLKISTITLYPNPYIETRC